jgi:hypothetical protein
VSALFGSLAARTPWKWGFFIGRALRRERIKKLLQRRVNKGDFEVNLSSPVLLALLRKSLIINGAGEGNRTLVSGLGSPHSTIEPHPQSKAMLCISKLLLISTQKFVKTPQID